MLWNADRGYVGRHTAAARRRRLDAVAGGVYSVQRRHNDLRPSETFNNNNYYYTIIIIIIIIN